MIKVTKDQKNSLEKAGLIKYKKVKNGIEIQSPNIYVANHEHMSRSKTYYVVEEPKIMKFLGLYEEKRNNKNKFQGKYNKFNSAKKGSKLNDK